MASASHSTREHDPNENSRQHPLVEWINDWGGVVVDGISAVGDFTLFMWRTMVWLFTRLPRKETLLPNFYQVGVLSLPVVALTGTFIGMVLAVQSHFQFSQIGLETRLGAVINMSLVRELGPVLAATMLAGRVGSAMAAELGTMRVTEQIDAFESMGANADSLSGRAPFSGLHFSDSHADDHGRFHGRGGGVLLQRLYSGHRPAFLPAQLQGVHRRLRPVRGRVQEPVLWCGDRHGQLLSRISLHAGSRRGGASRDGRIRHLIRADPDARSVHGYHVGHYLLLNLARRCQTVLLTHG